MATQQSADYDIHVAAIMERIVILHHTLILAIVKVFCFVVYYGISKTKKQLACSTECFALVTINSSRPRDNLPPTSCIAYV